MRHLAGSVLIALAGCSGGDTPPPVQPDPAVVAGAAESAVPLAPPTDAAAIDAPIDAVPVAVRIAIEGVLTAGPAPTVTALAPLEGAREALAGCARTSATASVALELGYTLTASGELPHLRTYGTVSPALVACAKAAVGALERPVESGDEPTDVYAVVILERDGQPVPSRPPAPSLHDDLRNAYCDLDVVSGAKDLPVAQKRDVMTAWFVANVRHPVAIHLAWEIGDANPADRAPLLERAVKRARIKKCASLS